MKVVHSDNFHYYCELYTTDLNPVCSLTKLIFFEE